MNDMWPMLQGFAEEGIRNAQDGGRNCRGFRRIVLEVAVVDGEVGSVLRKVNERVDQTEE